MSDPYVLVLYYSQSGNLRAMARALASGVEQAGIAARLRTVAEIRRGEDSVAETADICCSVDDLRNCSGLALGSPTRFGNMAAPLKFFLEECAEVWVSGELVDKPGAVFTSSGSLHGGQETTLHTMSIPLLHHGMLLVGVPYSVAGLRQTRSGGTPYGASHHAGGGKSGTLQQEERDILQAQGKRLGRLALLLGDLPPS